MESIINQQNFAREAHHQACQLCQAKDWRIIDVLSSGIWNTSSTALLRDELLMPIGCCNQCQHVQITTEFNERIFSLLYFETASPPSMFYLPKPGEPSPYGQMIDFFESELLSTANVADFGCGAGLTFNEINKRGIKVQSLTGVDFLPFVDAPNVNILAWDLNDLSHISNQFWPNGIDLAISTHVLEHVINPVDYLKGIAAQLSGNGKIFIEVPDCSDCTEEHYDASCSVVRGQHIHYYSKDSLSNFARLAGLKVVKMQRLQTRVISRLLVLLERSKSSELSDGHLALSRIRDSAAGTVAKHFSQIFALQEKLKQQIERSIAEHGEAALWGIGGDVYLLFKHHPSLVELFKAGRLKLFDQGLSEHTYMGQTIHNSKELPTYPFPIYIGPLYGATRESMHLVSKDWKSEVIDPYESDVRKR